MSHNCWTTYRFYTLLLRWGVFPLFPPVSAFRFRGGEQKKKKREHDHRENSSKREKIRGWKSKEEFTRSWGVEKQQQRKKVKKKKKTRRSKTKERLISLSSDDCASLIQFMTTISSVMDDRIRE